jgi:hypothetical protein
LEAGTGEAYADHFFSISKRLTDVDNLALGFKIGILAAQVAVLMRDADFEIAADRYIETSSESGAAAAEIFAGGIFFEGKSARVFSANT